MIGIFVRACELLPPMDEGTLKTLNPLMSSSLVILFGVMEQFGRFRIWSETECKTHAEYGPQHNSAPPNPPPPHRHTVCINRTFSLGKGEGGGGEVREKVKGQEYTSIVPSSMWGNSSQARTKIPIISECTSSL
jgi:hypothetical protein